MDFKREAELMKFKDKVFKYIAIRKKTVKEVEGKFKDDLDAPLYLDETIEYFKEMKYLDDRNYAELFTKDYINFKSNSAFEIRMKLKQKGVDTKIIDEVFNLLEDELKEMEVKNVKKVLKQKMSKGLVRVKNYLYRKGFKAQNITIAIDDYNYENGL